MFVILASCSSFRNFNFSISGFNFAGLFEDISKNSLGVIFRYSQIYKIPAREGEADSLSPYHNIENSTGFLPYFLGVDGNIHCGDGIGCRVWFKFVFLNGSADPSPVRYNKQ